VKYGIVTNKETRKRREKREREGLNQKKETKKIEHRRNFLMAKSQIKRIFIYLYKL
jgi:hypothetical protein